jgi:hypothetical protein
MHAETRRARLPRRDLPRHRNRVTSATRVVQAGPQESGFIGPPGAMTDAGVATVPARAAIDNTLDDEKSQWASRFLCPTRAEAA